MKGLIIDEPWISMILSGFKTWEMRSRMTTHRGPIALIQKGTGLIVGVAYLTNSTGPLTLRAISANAARHKVPLAEFEAGKAAKWNVAWHLERPKRLSTPVNYRHPSGAVTWVRLGEPTVGAIARQL